MSHYTGAERRKILRSVTHKSTDAASIKPVYDEVKARARKPLELNLVSAIDAIANARFPKEWAALQ